MNIQRLRSMLLPFTVSIFLLSILIFNLSLAVRTEVGRDEHLYVAAGYLISKEGLLPYRDFPFIHFPYLVLLEALIFKFTNTYFLAARFLSAFFATGTAIIVFFLSKNFARQLQRPWQYGIAFASVLLFIGNPLSVFTSGLAWNQVLATFLALLSFYAFTQADKNATMIRVKTGVNRPVLSPSLWILVSGLLLGLAIGTRSSIITLLPAFAIGILFLPDKTFRDRWTVIFHYSISFAIGLTVALLPLLYFYITAPKNFIFGNFTYHTLNTVFRQESNFAGPITLSERWSYFWNTVLTMPGNLLVLFGMLFFGLAVAGLSISRNLATSGMNQSENNDNAYLRFMLPSLIIFALVGSFIAAPSWYQYFYAPLPYAVLFIAYCVTRLLPKQFSWSSLFSTYALSLTLLTLFVTLYRIDDYRRITFLLHPEAWRPLIIHQAGKDISQVVQSGKVLTLTPIVPIEGGVQIYPKFMNLFVYRVLPYISAEERQILGLPLLTNLNDELKDDLPAGILVGMEATQEQPLIECAQSLGYHPIPITKTLSLWIPSP